ncbi:hypothetical protein FWF89_01825 [Candidatus Saccharibacteria bacterium]|nr:hypothetical protein [Candidatus Saccharibacteria bacterium]
MKTYLLGHDAHGDARLLPSAPSDCERIIIAGDMVANRPSISVDPDSWFQIVKYYFGMGSKQGALGNGFLSSAHAEAGMQVALRDICGDAQYQRISKWVNIATIRGRSPSPYPRPKHNGVYFSWLAKQAPNLRSWIHSQVADSNSEMVDKMVQQWQNAQIILIKGNGEYGSMLGYAVDDPHNWNQEVLADCDPLIEPFLQYAKCYGWTIVDDKPLKLDDIDATLLGEGWFRWAKTMLEADQIDCIIDSIPTASRLITHYPPLFDPKWYKDVKNSPNLPNQITQDFGKIVDLILDLMDFTQLTCAHLHNRHDVEEYYLSTDIRIMGLGSICSI